MCGGSGSGGRVAGAGAEMKNVQRLDYNYIKWGQPPIIDRVVIPSVLSGLFFGLVSFALGGLRVGGGYVGRGGARACSGTNRWPAVARDSCSV